MPRLLEDRTPLGGMEALNTSRRGLDDKTHLNPGFLFRVWGLGFRV